MADDDMYLYCSRASDAPREVANFWHNCSGCLTVLAISSTMRPLVEAGQMTPMCGECFERHAATVEDDPEFIIHPWQVDQLADLNMLNFSATYVDRMNAALRSRKRK